LEPHGIVRAALGVLDEVGLDELSMRRLAEALGVQNPALYWHVQNKQELLDRMAQVLLTEGLAAVEAAMPQPRSWSKKLELFARALRDAMCSRKDGARLIAVANLSQPGSALLIRIDALVAVLMSEGFRAGDALRGVLTVIHYTLGATLEQQSDPRGGEPTMQPDASLPTLTALAKVRDKEGLSRVDARFEFGVELIVEGLRARLRTRREGR
jgi:TetR/AcrR family transcriptional regulator, tetracycline repressor protein